MTLIMSFDGNFDTLSNKIQDHSTYLNIGKLYAMFFNVFNAFLPSIELETRKEGVGID